MGNTLNPEKSQQKLFIVIQNTNAFEENYYESYLWAKDHDEANEKAQIKYPDGYLTAEITGNDLVSLLFAITGRKQPAT